MSSTLDFSYRITYLKIVINIHTSFFRPFICGINRISVKGIYFSTITLVLK